MLIIAAANVRPLNDQQRLNYKIYRKIVGMACDNVSLSALLSKALVAFTMEFDNEFEHRMPHRTALSRAEEWPERGTWLSSLVMWANFMQFVPEEGRSIAQIEGLARTTRLPLAGMTRWGYITIEPDSESRRTKQIQLDWVVRPTRGGQAAQGIWGSLGGIIEDRWRTRFGSAEIDTLRGAITAILECTDDLLPDYLPLVSYGLWSKGLVTKQPLPRLSDTRVDLSTLLSRLLLLFATEFETASPLSLAVCANCLRVLGESGTPVREIPLRTGISKDACAVSLGYLEREGYITLKSGSEYSRIKRASLKAKGVEAQEAARERVEAIERDWSEHHGQAPIQQLRHALEQILAATTGGRSRIAEGLSLHSDGWRFSKSYLARTTELVRDPAAALPQFPIVSHRGGYPDGS